jgi:hypothetical protein
VDFSQQFIEALLALACLHRQAGRFDAPRETSRNRAGCRRLSGRHALLDL